MWMFKIFLTLNDGIVNMFRSALPVNTYGNNAIGKAMAKRVLPDVVFWTMVALSLFAATILYSNGYTVHAASAESWEGNVSYLAKAMKATVSLVRMFSALLAVIMGAWVAIKWKHAGQQAQGELINYLVMLFFLFGATLFIDAVIAVTVGKFSFISSGSIGTNESPNMQWS